MKRLAIVLFFLEASFMLQAQDMYKLICRTVSAESGEAIENIRVLVMDSVGNSVAVKKVGECQGGKVSLLLSNGEYRIRISASGYQKLDRKFAVNNCDVDLGVMRMTPGEVLKESKVTARPVLRRTSDRVIYDVSRDPEASRISMMKMMEKIPDLIIGSRRGRLEYAQQPIARILIDDDEHPMINGGRQYPMEFIKADHMKKIELVLPHSPQYNNEEPIVVITLAKELPYGVSGQLSADASTKNEYNPGLDIVTNTPYMGVGVNYMYAYNAAPALSDQSVTQTTDAKADYQQKESYSDSRSYSHNHNISLNLFGDITKDIRVVATLRTNAIDSWSFARSATRFTDKDGDVLMEETTQNTSHTRSPFRFNGALRLSGKFGPQEGKRNIRSNRWSVSYSYSDTRKGTTSDSNTSSSDSYKQISDDINREHRVDANISMKSLLKGPVNLGMSSRANYYNRYISTSENNSLYGIGNNTGMNYRQNVAAMNVLIMGKALNNNLSFSGTLIAEYVGNRGMFDNAGEYTALDYQEFNFIPGAGLGYRIKDHSLNLSYSQRVKRPNVNQLNPYVEIRDFYNRSEGNPALHGEKKNIVTIGYSFSKMKGWFDSVNMNLSYDHSSNTISRYITTDVDGITTTTYCNMGKADGVIALFRAGFRPAKHMYLVLNATYRWNRYSLPDGLVNKVNTPDAYVLFTWDNPKIISLTANFGIVATSTLVQTAKYKIEPKLELSASHYFEKPHIGIGVICSDLIHPGGMQESTIIGANFVRSSHIERRGMAALFNIYWRFGRFIQNESVKVAAHDM